MFRVKSLENIETHKESKYLLDSHQPEITTIRMSQAANRQCNSEKCLYISGEGTDSVMDTDIKNDI